MFFTLQLVRLRRGVLPLWSCSSIRRKSSATDCLSTSRLISLSHAAIISPTGQTLLHDLSWQIKEDETWAVVGPAACGKTTLLETLRGRCHVEPAKALTYPYIERLRRLDNQGEARSLWPSKLIRMVNFHSAGSSSALYISERYEAYRDDKDPTLRDYFNGRKEHSDNFTDQVDGIDYWANKFDLSQYLNSSLMNLSNGQRRRAEIIKELLKAPVMLLMDEPFTGLDVENRALLNNILLNLVQERRLQVVLAIRAQDEIPQCVTHILELSKDGKAINQGSIEEVIPRLTRVSNDRIVISKPKNSWGYPLVHLSNISVDYRCKDATNIVLKDISWTICEGERWALAGPNGSGKTTLLSMILGDNPKSWASDIMIFGKKRGSGESLFDIQEKIGHVSPELHHHFPRHLKICEAIATAFSATFQPPKLTSKQSDAISSCIEVLNLSEYQNLPFRCLTTSQQKLTLFARALVHEPSLIIMDEPFQGMDYNMVACCKKILDDKPTEKQALVFVSHYETDWPFSINKVYKLDGEGGGKVHVLDPIKYS